MRLCIGAKLNIDETKDLLGRYSYEKVKQMVKRQKDKFGWEFLFLGANIDAIAEADRFGINANRAVNYHCDKEGTAVNYRALNRAVSSVRKCKDLCEMDAALSGWDEDIKENYRKRR